MEHIYLITFCLIFIIGIIQIMGDLATSVLVVSLLTNFIVLFLCMRKVSSIKQNEAAKTPASSSTTTMANFLESGEDFAADAPNPLNPFEQPPALAPMYTPEFMGDHSRVKDTYMEAYPKKGICDVGITTMDDNNVQIARFRGNRDKQAIDGGVVKNADYYKAHYGTEFEESENAVWWGRNEY
jgi:hypothetical protein